MTLIEAKRSRINKWAEDLTERIFENKFFEKEEIENLLKIYVPIIIKDCLQDEDDVIKKKIEEAKHKLYTCNGIGQNAIQKELTELNRMKVQVHNLRTSTESIVKSNVKYQHLHDIVFEKVGKEEMMKIDDELWKRLDKDKL